ncbi:hypothetical protein ACLOJK_001926 [Asimina triloba]
MHYLKYTIPLLLVLSFSCKFSLAIVSDPRISQVGLFCGSARSSIDLISYFVATMESLSEHVARSGWGTHANGTVYGLAQCHSDLSTNDCLLCFAQARTKLPRCLPSNSGRIFLDGCFLRYDNYSFYSEAVDPDFDKAVCSSNATSTKADQSRLEQSVGSVLKTVIETAVQGGGFGVGTTSNVYGLAQCWKSLGKEECRKCLQKAEREASGCLPAKDGKALNAGCYLRYSTQLFYNSPEAKVDAGDDSNGGINDRVFVFSIAASAVIVAMLSILGVFIGYGRLEKKRKERQRLSQLSIVARNANLHFKYELLEKATNFFDDSRKLGQGGSGSVYKGVLADGRTVAVKRLFFNTRQWVDEFFNEINLISGIHHPNLVQLLGCSIEGPESLLVYEYVPNKSLDQILFNKRRMQTLSWQDRLGIIVGTAKGLAYLHEGSGNRIIHRDIKSSNILLDENLQAKIADFGLVRCFSGDRTHISTGIAGTLNLDPALQRQIP